MRFMTWIAHWIPATFALTGVNVILFLFLIWRDWRFRKGLYTLDLHIGPNTLSDHALALHLGLLQTTLVGIGVGLTILGVLGFRSVQKEAVKEAVTKAVESAEEEAVKVAREKADEVSGEVARETAEKIAEEVARNAVARFLGSNKLDPIDPQDTREHDPGRSDEPNPFTLTPRS